MGAATVRAAHGGITTMDAMHSKYKVNAEVANPSSTTATNSTAATSIGIQSKNKNLLLQNSKLKFKLIPKMSACAKELIAATVRAVHGGTALTDVMHSKYKVNAVDVNHSPLNLTKKPSTAATSIGIQSKNKTLLSPNSKNKNLLLQNSKLKFKLTPKMSTCAKELIAATVRAAHGGTALTDVMHSKYKVNAVDVNHSPLNLTKKPS